MTQAELTKTFKDEEFLKELFSKETPEEAQACLESRGIELTLQQVEKLGDILAKVGSGEMTMEELNDKAKDELPEDDLEEVAGGTLELPLFINAVGNLIEEAYEFFRRW